MDALNVPPNLDAATYREFVRGSNGFCVVVIKRRNNQRWTKAVVVEDANFVFEHGTLQTDHIRFNAWFELVSSS
jgi:hypothetical protein